jgi:hypothetical protein
VVSMSTNKQGAITIDGQYNVLVRMLLRHYAKNRRRSWRNSPHDAFLDASIQVEGALALFIVAPFALIYLILSRTTVPWLAQIAFDKVTKGGAIVALLSLVIFVCIDVSFKRYEFVPGIETHYDSERDRNLVNLYFVGSLGVLAITLLAAHFIKMLLPPIS